MLRLLRSRRALAGVEFAILLPFLLTLFFGLADAASLIIMSRRLTVAAMSTATIASTTAVQSSSLNLLSGTTAWQATTAPFALFPQWRGSVVNGNFAITLSSVNFKPSSGSYNGNVAWSVANPAGQPNLRKCGAVTPVPDSTASSLTTLPQDSFGATPILVADVSGVFVPLFTAVLVGPVTLLRSAYVSPRLNSAVSLSSAFPGPYATC